MSIMPVSTHETHQNPTIPNRAPQARSEAQRAAARANGARSRGPISASGKDRARRNALKHGLSGTGVAVPDDLQREAARLAVEYARDLRPSSERERVLVERVALADARWRRLALADDRRTAERVRHAVEAWDARRDAEVAALAATLEPRMLPDRAHDPGAAVAKLRRTAEGCDFLSDAWDALVRALDDRGGWTELEAARAAHLLGRPAAGPRREDDGWWRAFWLDVRACRPMSSPPARASARNAPIQSFASLPPSPLVGEGRGGGDDAPSVPAPIQAPSSLPPSPLVGEGRGGGDDASRAPARSLAPSSLPPSPLVGEGRGGGDDASPTDHATARPTSTTSVGAHEAGSPARTTPPAPPPGEREGHGAAPPDRDAARARLRQLAEDQIAELRERADTLWETLDAPDRAESPDRALFDHTTDGARLARYLNDAERTSRRALAELERLRCGKGSRGLGPSALGVEGSREEGSRGPGVEGSSEERTPDAEPAPPAPPAPAPRAPRETNPAPPPLLPWRPDDPVDWADPAARSEFIPVAITPPRRL